MSFGDMKFLRKLGHGILSVTAALTVLLGGWLLISAMSDAPESEVLALERNEIASRAPSSIPAMSGALSVDKSDDNVETVTLGCIQDGASIALESAAKQVRIRGKFCGGEQASLEQSQLLNKANGFEATLFGLEKGGFTSDYIALASGANRLLLTLSLGAGAKSVAEVVISRK